MLSSLLSVGMCHPLNVPMGKHCNHLISRADNELFILFDRDTLPAYCFQIE